MRSFMEELPLGDTSIRIRSSPRSPSLPPFHSVCLKHRSSNQQHHDGIFNQAWTMDSGKNEGSETVSLTIDRAVGACLKGGSDESTVPPEAPFNRHHPCRVFKQSGSDPTESHQSVDKVVPCGRNSVILVVGRACVLRGVDGCVPLMAAQFSRAESINLTPTRVRRPSASAASAREPFLSGKIGPRLLPSLYLTGCRKLAS